MRVEHLVKKTTQTCILRHFVLEGVSIQSPRPASGPHPRAERGHRHAAENGAGEHALAPDQRDLQAGRFIGLGHQRDRRVHREVDVAQRPAEMAQCFAGRQPQRFAVFAQALQLSRRQPAQQPVA